MVVCIQCGCQHRHVWWCVFNVAVNIDMYSGVYSMWLSTEICMVVCIQCGCQHRHVWWCVFNVAVNIDMYGGVYSMWLST